MEDRTVVIVGGGFAGLNAARTLSHAPGVRVLLIDSRNHHLFQPLLYQVATAALNPSDIAAPIRAQFAGVPNVEVHLAQVERVDLARKSIRVVFESKPTELPFDSLVLACGAQHSYFAHPEWEPFAPGLKTLEQATEIRRRILLAFERAENEIDPVAQAECLSFVIVGAGPTGAELAGAIAEISRTVLVRDFKRIRPEAARVYLVEAGPRVLAGFDERLSTTAQKDLERLGVEVLLNSRVDQLDATGIRIGAREIRAQSVFWAAGVQATRMEFAPAVETDRAGRVIVAPDFSVPGHPDVFVVGDMASWRLPDGRTLPGLAPVAIQAGRFVARAILASLAGRPRPKFKYLDKGLMATIGKSKAIAQTGKLRMRGTLAWFAWLFVHIFYLIGFKNRISVMALWTWSYLFSRRGSRLITEKEWKLR